jgi:hypothetical protein
MDERAETTAKDDGGRRGLESSQASAAGGWAAMAQRTGRACCDEGCDEGQREGVCGRESCVVEEMMV